MELAKVGGNNQTSDVFSNVNILKILALTLAQYCLLLVGVPKKYMEQIPCPQEIDSSICKGLKDVAIKIWLYRLWD